MSVTERAFVLKQGFGFVCECNRCVVERERERCESEGNLAGGESMVDKMETVEERDIVTAAIVLRENLSNSQSQQHKQQPHHEIFSLGHFSAPTTAPSPSMWSSEERRELLIKMESNLRTKTSLFHTSKFPSLSTSASTNERESDIGDVVGHIGHHIDSDHSHKQHKEMSFRVFYACHDISLTLISLPNTSIASSSAATTTSISSITTTMETCFLGDQVRAVVILSKCWCLINQEYQHAHVDCLLKGVTVVCAMFQCPCNTCQIVTGRNNCQSKKCEEKGRGRLQIVSGIEYIVTLSRQILTSLKFHVFSPSLTIDNSNKDMEDKRSNNVTSSFEKSFDCCQYEKVFVKLSWLENQWNSMRAAL